MQTEGPSKPEILVKLGVVEFLRQGFRIAVDEIELEKGLQGARIRGFIDALYRSLVIEVKRDLEAERCSAVPALELGYVDWCK